MLAILIAEGEEVDCITKIKTSSYLEIVVPYNTPCEINQCYNSFSKDGGKQAERVTSSLNGVYMVFKPSKIRMWARMSLSLNDN